jgi:hypothetical protein
MTAMKYEIFVDANGRTRYRLLEAIVYMDKRTGKVATIPANYVSNGASGPAIDIASLSWLVHDWLVETMRWDDGSYCSIFQSSLVLHDILVEENRRLRAKTWFLATLLYGIIRGRVPKLDVPNKIDTGGPPIAFT